MGSGPRDWTPYEPEPERDPQPPRWGERTADGLPPSLWLATPEPSPFADIHRRRRRRTLAWVWTGTAVLALLLAGTVAARAIPFTQREWVATAFPVAAPVVGIPATTSDVVEIAHRTLLTEQGRELLYGTSPQILGDDVAEACARPSDHPGDEIVAVGCYAGWLGAGRIFVYRPSDARLAGSMVTTTAHELLHAAYDRMDAAEQHHVDELVAAETARLAPDDQTLKQIDWSVGGVEGNRGTEQFAYLGTQELPEGGFAPELEQIYARWFTDRAALVQAYRASLAVVDDLVAQLQAALDQLAADAQAAADARAQYQADRAWHEQAVPQYNDDAARFNAMSPTERTGWTQTLTLPSGEQRTMSLSDALAYRLDELDRMNASLESRRPAIEQQEADVAAERTRVEALQADLKNLLDAAYPGRG